MKKKEYKAKNISIKSPEELESHIKINSPGMWAVVIIGILVLGAFLFWAATGAITTKVTAISVVYGGVATAYVPEADAENIKPGQEMTIEGKLLEVGSVGAEPVAAEDLRETMDDYTFYLLDPPEWSYEVTAAAPDVEDGVRVAGITTEKVKPISFIFQMEGGE